MNHAPRRSARIGPPDAAAAEVDGYRLPDGRPLALFGVLSHSEPALADLRGATMRALQATSLEARPRELLILRILSNLGAEAERQAHVALFAEPAAIDDADLRALGEPRHKGSATPSDLDEERGLMFDLADALTAGGRVEPQLWDLLTDTYGERGTVEAIFIGAQYVKVAIMNNAFEVVPPFPRADVAGGGRAER
jgi:hypothetical protein